MVINMMGITCKVKALFILQLFSCFLLSSAIDEGTCRYRKWSKPGTLTIQVVAGIHEADDIGKCSSRLSKRTLDQLVALDWITDIVSGRTNFSTGLIPGHTVGKCVHKQGS